MLEREIEADGAEHSFVALECHGSRGDDLGGRGDDIDGVAMPIAPAMLLMSIGVPVERAKQGGGLSFFRDDDEVDVCRAALERDVMIQRDRADDHDAPPRLRTTESDEQIAVSWRDRERHGTRRR